MSEISAAMRTLLNLGTRDAGARILRNVEDPYVQVLSEREMMARIKRPAKSKQDFAESQAACVTEWSERDHEELARVQPIMLASIEQHANRVLDWLPPQTDIFLTTGAEETSFCEGLKSRIAYCRGTRSMFFSRAYLDWETRREAADHVLMHELWHIVSRNMPAEALDQVYAAFGFRRLPKALRNFHESRMSNPDALILEHSMELEGRSYVPVLMLDPKFDVLKVGESPFDNIKILIALLKEDRSGFQGPLYDLEDNMEMLVSVMDLIGRNTGYLLHIEEAVAENFAMLVRQEKVEDTEKLQQLKSILHKQ